jgi:RNA 2',3'-cyclic 3'-phosphodiesterase
MSAPEDSWRLFVALALPQEVKARLADVQSELRCLLHSSSASWTRPENFHLTIRFLGKVTKRRCEALACALAAVAAIHTPLELTAQRLGCFPNVRRPHVVWAGVHDDRKQLERLQQKVNNATAPFTAEPPEKKLIGHITLARIKRLRRVELTRVGDFIAANATRGFGQWRSASLLLMRSEPMPTGSRYTPLAELPFPALV